MADKKLRAVIVYRLEGFSSTLPPEKGLSAIPVAKYDHAKEYNADVEEGSVYGDRDGRYPESVGMVIRNDPPGAVADYIGGFKSVQSASAIHKVVYGADCDGLCLAVITGADYPTRVAVKMITELYGPYSNKFGLQAKSATALSLSRKSKSLLSESCRKYDDLSHVEYVAGLLQKVEDAKEIMQSNIVDMQSNQENAEQLVERSDMLLEESSVFKKQSTSLRKQMGCKNLKYTILLVAVVAIALGALIIPLVHYYNNNSY